MIAVHDMQWGEGLRRVFWRLVSGYLIQLSGSAADAPATDSADLHAWAEAYVPAAEGHLPLARGATPALAAPVTGSVEPCNSHMQFSMSVQRLT